MNERSGAFGFRTFVTLVIAVTGVSLPVSGIANHVTGFEPLTATRHVWLAVHNGLRMLFVVFSVWHIALNFRALGGHAQRAARRVFPPSREVLLAVAVASFTLLVSVGHVFLMGAAT